MPRCAGDFMVYLFSFFNSFLLLDAQIQTLKQCKRKEGINMSQKATDPVADKEAADPGLVRVDRVPDKLCVGSVEVVAVQMEIRRNVERL